MRRIALAAMVVFGLGTAWVTAEQPVAHAQAKKAAKAAKKPAKKGAKGKGKGKGEDEEAAEDKTEEAAAGDEKSGDDKRGKGEGKAKGAPSEGSSGGPKVIETKGNDDGGVKTYTFGPVEVEGRLKSPQVIYFLRRVRAEFAAGDLGHRSFMREMSDTRRHPSMR
ncbi:MAG: hypothetical protein R3B13_32970 [Polyangiaceae bacterium]